MTTTITVKPIAPTPGIKSISTGGFSSTKVINNFGSSIQLFYIDPNGIEHIDGPAIQAGGEWTQKHKIVIVLVMFLELKMLQAIF